MVDNEPKNTIQNKNFSIEDIISKSWRLTMDQIAILILIMLIIFLVYAATHLITGFLLYPIKYVGPLLAAIINIIVGCILGVGFVYIGLKVSRNQNVSVGDLFTKAGLFLPYFISSLIQEIIVGIGLVLLIIPGIFFAIRFSTSLYALVDRNLGPWEAIKESWDLVKGCTWKVLGFILVLFLINLLGLLLFIVGVLVTAPLTTVAFALLYRELHRQTHGAEIIEINPS